MKTMNSSGKGLSRKNWFAVEFLAVMVIAAPMAHAQAPTAKDYLQPDGTKIFGERTLTDGTITIVRKEFANGVKSFDVTVLPDHTEKVGRQEFSDGEKRFDVTVLPDHTEKSGRVEFPNGVKSFDVTILPDHTQKVGRYERPNGEKRFDVTVLPDHTEKAGRQEFSDGEKRFDLTVLPDHTEKYGRIELPDGEKRFDVTRLPDGTKKIGRVEFPDGRKDFDVTTLPDGTRTVGRRLPYERAKEIDACGGSAACAADPATGAKDYQLPDGTKIFGERTLKDGTVTRERVEYANGEKRFIVTILPGNSEKDGRIEFPGGQKDFDVTIQRGINLDSSASTSAANVPDYIWWKVGRIESPTGMKRFDVTILPDHTEKDGRMEFPDGHKRFDVTLLPDHTEKYGRIELPDGEKSFEVTRLPDGTIKYGRVEKPDGSKNFDVTILPDGTQKVGRRLSAQAETEQVQSRFFTFRGVHAGMTVEEVNAATSSYRGGGPNDSPEMRCSYSGYVASYGGTNSNKPTDECVIDAGVTNADFHFYRGKLYSIDWHCEYDKNCAEAIALMNAHFGKPQSDRKEIIRAQVGGFMKQVIIWRSPVESATVVGAEHFEVLNYDFAPPSVERQ